MMDPRQVASQLLGAIDWQTEVSGFCRCPGEAFHTSANGKRDCRVNVDGAPTIFCFHASCAAAVAEATRRFCREMGASPWESRLLKGRLLPRSNVLQDAALVRPRDNVKGDCRVNVDGAAKQFCFDALRAA